MLLFVCALILSFAIIKSIFSHYRNSLVKVDGSGYIILYFLIASKGDGFILLHILTGICEVIAMPQSF